jgi:crotonobetainyl-CoA:carnitine CoA-transferase CaiB-like acyl-CoA transferase
MALRGLTVVAMEQAVAAPLCTCRLADMGARVIKVERPEGDFARAYDRFVHGETSSYFTWLNRGKESLVANIKDGEDAALLRRIIGKADVFVQNLAPGAAARAGFGAAELRAANPGLVTLDISGYGVSGGDKAGMKVSARGAAATVAAAAVWWRLGYGLARLALLRRGARALTCPSLPASLRPSHPPCLPASLPTRRPPTSHRAAPRRTAPSTFAPRQAYDLLVQAESGICSVTGTPDGPGRVGISVCDITAGLNGYNAVVTALLGRERGLNRVDGVPADAGVGEAAAASVGAVGAQLSVSLFDSAAEIMAVPLLQQAYTGAAPKRVGLAHPSIAPCECALRAANAARVVVCGGRWGFLCGGSPN